VTRLYVKNFDIIYGNDGYLINKTLQQADLKTSSGHIFIGYIRNIIRRSNLSMIYIKTKRYVIDTGTGDTNH